MTKEFKRSQIGDQNKLKLQLAKIRKYAEISINSLTIDRGTVRFKGRDLVSATIDETVDVATIVFDAGPAFGLTAALKTIQNLTFTAKQVGDWFANDVTITLVDPGEAAALSVVVQDHKILVVLENDGANVVSTAGEIKTAIEADAAANALVSIVIEDDSDNPFQDVQAITNLADGIDSVKSSKIIQDLTFTADAAGVAGDDITVEYADDGAAGAETVEVAGTAILVHMEDGASTATMIKTAVDALPAAAALVDVAITGVGGNFQLLQVATDLEGGVDAVKASKKIQNLNFLADTAGIAGNAITVAYVDDGAAGAETVGVLASALTVHMEAGVSTAAQLKTAIDGTPAAAALVDVTVDAGADTLQVAQAETALEGGTSEQTYDKADIIMIKRLRTRKWAIKLASDSDPS